MQKQMFFKPVGMQRDLAASAFNPEYAYENKNIRIITTEDNSLLSISNERGPKLINIIGGNISGTVLGKAVINNILVLFTTVDNIDRIYRININEDTASKFLLFEGNLNFNVKYPIETLVYYENEDIQKVYWTDGLNPLRMINIMSDTDTIQKWNDKSFDFIPKLNSKEEVEITRADNSGGLFPAGVIQYALTYFNAYGQESNIFYASPLYYISYPDRGGSPEDKIGVSFNIKVNNIDYNFDYIRVYSIVRTSINTTPEVKRVIDLQLPGKEYSDTTVTEYNQNNQPLNSIILTAKNGEIRLSDITPTTDEGRLKTWTLSSNDYPIISLSNGDVLTFPKGYTLNIIHSSGAFFCKLTDDYPFVKTSFTRRNYIEYTDNGLSGSSIDPTELLYVGGEDVISNTLNQKDNVLFLGNITLKRKSVNKDIRDIFNNKEVRFITSEKELVPPEPKGYYNYKNQLNLNSLQIKTFKYLEWYRFGVQFQDSSGRWSEAVWINDVKNNEHVDTQFFNNSNIKLPIGIFNLDNKASIEKIINAGYTRIRPVIVYPTINDRESICQGILCPTVYNVGDRASNSPFVQSSWFTRANAPFDIIKSEKDYGKLGNTGFSTPDVYSRYGIVNNQRIEVTQDEEVYDLDMTNKGALAEFRHNRAIPGNDKRNAEIQCISNPPELPYLNFDEDSVRTEWINNNSENYYIDQSIVTLHSPDIEFDDNVKNLDFANTNLRIVGIVPITAFSSDIDITTSTPQLKFRTSDDSISYPAGFYKESIGVENGFNNGDIIGDSHFGYKSLISGAFWFDEIYSYKDSNTHNDNKLTTAFVVYPWHRSGSLNNQMFSDKNGYRSSLLDKKKMSNMRFSYKSVYLPYTKIWNTHKNSDGSYTGISDAVIFDSDEQTLVRLKSPKNSELPDINYYGNVDKIINISRVGSKKDGYPIIVTGTQDADKNKDAHKLFTSAYQKLSSSITNDVNSVDPIRITYKSTPHAIIALNYNKETSIKQVVLPTITDYDVSASSGTWTVNDSNRTTSVLHSFWDKNKVNKGVLQDVISNNDLIIDREMSTIGGIQYGWLWLGELYRENVINRFGGQSDEAFENNEWLSCGKSISLFNEDGTSKEYIDIEWTEGDTYYQRYDHIKTYPYTKEDTNSMLDIISFMCETRINIDGRYDKNRGQLNNFSLSPENFNKMNNVYTQSNNFFVYRALNYNKIIIDRFPNLVTWTRTKVAGELVDAWTNITLASTLDFDGDKGSLNSIKRWNNNLIVFQDKGLSSIMFNENALIPTSAGLSVELAKSGKVTGKNYISDKIGCINKWSICETPNGLYFIDDINKDIYLFNGSITNISDKGGFHSWMQQNSNTEIWNPIDFNNVVTYYDKNNSDILFINKEQCLAYSESLGRFTSFYSYESVPYFISIDDINILVKDDKLWEHNKGEYNMFFGKYQPYYITIIANADMYKDKTFNNIEYTSSNYSDSEFNLNTFDKLVAWNEYQYGEDNLTFNNVLPSNLKGKFRIWRANIPRDKSNKLNRMRNPWLYLKLSREKENTDKSILHSIIVKYFE